MSRLVAGLSLLSMAAFPALGLPINITEAMTAGVQVLGNGQPQVGGVVLVCDGPVSSAVGMPPNPLRNLCGGPGLPNNGISDVVVFLPNVSGVFVPTAQGVGLEPTSSSR